MTNFAMLTYFSMFLKPATYFDYDFISLPLSSHEKELLEIRKRSTAPTNAQEAKDRERQEAFAA